jgi:hypothetical protein
MRFIHRAFLVAAMAGALGKGSAYPVTTWQKGTPAQTSRDSRARLAGTWRYQTRDATTSQRIVLILRSDGSYTKTLDARVNGANYGGTHSGTWTANGTVVSLSGDGNWPAYTHDLSTFQKD